jgi:hypothetical protein
MTKASDNIVERIVKLVIAHCKADGDDVVFDKDAAERDVRTVLATHLEEVVRLRALISEESIERLATDIAIACVDCRQEIREARHRAMVRLGERLRNPLSRDLAALTQSEGA